MESSREVEILHAFLWLSFIYVFLLLINLCYNFNGDKVISKKKNPLDTNMKRKKSQKQSKLKIKIKIGIQKKLSKI